MKIEELGKVNMELVARGREGSRDAKMRKKIKQLFNYMKLNEKHLDKE